MGQHAVRREVSRARLHPARKQGPAGARHMGAKAGEETATLMSKPSDRHLQLSGGIPQGERKSNRIDDIEVLRAIAVIFVIFYHCDGSLFTSNQTLELFNKYFDLSVGVNIFFGVSGFVIARSILPSLLNSGSYRAFTDITLSFWVRRIWRLLPSAWLWLVLIQLAAIYFNESNAFRGVRTNFGALE